jgi:hypothetical protein
VAWKENPADLLTRPIEAGKFWAQRELWLQGSAFLHRPEDEWTQGKIVYEEVDLPQQELRREVVNLTNPGPHGKAELNMQNFCSLRRFQNMVVRMLRWKMCHRETQKWQNQSLGDWSGNAEDSETSTRAGLGRRA